uniref:Uncharacterized protein n=1 Tax=Anguilla anguilla TaxID=7936 RepID=A0A0E9XAP4_ANGAN
MQFFTKMEKNNENLISYKTKDPRIFLLNFFSLLFRRLSTPLFNLCTGKFIHNILSLKKDQSQSLQACIVIYMLACTHINTY